MGDHCTIAIIACNFGRFCQKEFIITQDHEKKGVSFFVWLGAMFFGEGRLGSFALPPSQKSKQQRQTKKDTPF